MIMEEQEKLLSHINEVHTTTLGVERIQRNLGLRDMDVVLWCQEKIKDLQSVITRRGKNWYITDDDCVITVNAYSYTIITAHKVKKR